VIVGLTVRTIAGIDMAKRAEAIPRIMLNPPNSKVKLYGMKHRAS
jgi:hypothetical protein